MSAIYSSKLRPAPLLALIGAIGLLMYWQGHTVPNRHPKAEATLPLEEQPSVNAI